MKCWYAVSAMVDHHKIWSPSFVKRGDVVYLDVGNFFGPRWSYFDEGATLFESPEKAINFLDDHSEVLFNIDNTINSFVCDRNTVEIIELAPKIMMRSGDIWQWKQD